MPAEIFSLFVVGWGLSRFGGLSVEYRQRHGESATAQMNIPISVNAQEEGMMKFVAAFRMGLWFSVGCSLLLPGTVSATYPAGVVSNVSLGQGFTAEGVHEHIRLGDSWCVSLDVSAPAD